MLNDPKNPPKSSCVDQGSPIPTRHDRTGISVTFAVAFKDRTSRGGTRTSAAVGEERHSEPHLHCACCHNVPRGGGGGGVLGHVHGDGVRRCGAGVVGVTGSQLWRHRGSVLGGVGLLACSPKSGTAVGRRGHQSAADTHGHPKSIARQVWRRSRGRRKA